MGKLVDVTFRQLVARLTDKVVGYHMFAEYWRLAGGPTLVRIPRRGEDQTPDQRVDFLAEEVADWGVYESYRRRSLVVRLRDGSELGVPVTSEGQRVQAPGNHKTIVKILGSILGAGETPGIKWVPEGKDWVVCRERQ